MLKGVKYLFILMTMNLHAQKVMLDSNINHYIVFYEIQTNSEVKYKFTEYYDDILMSKGNLKVKLNDYTLSLIKASGLHSIHNHFTDTCITFNVHGDTLEFSFYKEGILLENIKYINNIRNYHFNAKTNSIWHKSKSGYVYLVYNKISFPNVEIEKSKIVRIEIKDENGIKVYNYSNKFSSAPYYESGSDTYYNFDLYSFDEYHNEGNQEKTKVTYKIKKIGNNLYQLNDKTEYEGYSHTKRIALVKKRSTLEYFIHKKRNSRYNTKDFRTLSLIETYENSTKEIKLNKKGQIISYKIDYKNSSNNSLKGNQKSLLLKIIGNSMYYASDEFSGIIHKFKNSCEIIDTFKIDKDIYISNGTLKNSKFEYKTYKNGKIYKSSNLEMYYDSKNLFYIDPYNDGFEKNEFLQEIHYMLHFLNLNYGDTLYFKDSILTLSYQQLILQENGKTSILFDSINKFLYLAKDQLHCSMGVKGKDSTWIIPAQYDHVEFVYLYNNIGALHASINNYATLFDKNGKTLIPLTRGLSSTTINLSLIGVNQNRFINSKAWICNDLTTDSFKIIDVYNKIHFSGKGKFTFYPQTVQVYSIQKGKYLDLIDKNGKINKRPLKYFIQLTDSLYILAYKSDSSNSDSFEIYDFNYGPLHQLTFYDKQKLNDIEIFTGKNQQIFFFRNGKYVINTSGNSAKITPLVYHYLLTLNNLNGLYNSYGNLIIPAKYQKFYIGSNLIIANTENESHIYTKKGVLLKTMDKIHPYKYNTTKDYMHTISDVSYRDGKEWKSLILIRKDKKKGLMQNDGKVLFECDYDEIYIVNHNSYFEENQNLEIFTLKDEKVSVYLFKENNIVSNYKKEAFIFQYSTRNLQSLIGDNGNSIVKEKIIIKQISVHNSGIYFFLVYENDKQSGERKLLGKLDYKGRWIINFENYKMVKPLNSFYYVQTKEDLCGILDKDLNFIIKPQFKYIFYDWQNELLWFKNSEKELWKLCKTKNSIVVLDSFDFPISIPAKANYQAVTRNGYWGLIDYLGNTYQKPKYDLLAYSPYNLQYTVGLLNEKIHAIIDKDSSVKQNYLDVFTNNNFNDNYNPKIALRDNMIYCLQSYNSIDSSNQLFLKSSASTRKLLAKNEHGMNRQINYNLRVFDNKLIVANLSMFTREKFEFDWYIPHFEESFPSSKNQYSTKEFYFKYKQYNNDDFEFNDTLKISDFANKNFKYYCESRNTITLTNNSYNNNHNSYLNIYFDTLDNAFKFNLNSIIDPNLKDTFTKFLHQKWLKNDNLSYPCIDPNNVFAFFEDKFILNSKTFIFYPDRYDIRLTVDEVIHFLKPIWKDRL